MFEGTGETELEQGGITGSTQFHTNMKFSK